MIQGFLEAAAGQHCMATVLGLVARWLPGAPAVPCGNTGRMWLWRVGLYALTSQKAVAEDWVYIFDHTVQLGKTKVLIIVGIRLSQWESQGRGPLRHKDIAVLDVVPMEHSSEHWMARMALGLSGSCSAMATCSAILHCVWWEMASLAVTTGASASWLVFIASLGTLDCFSVPDCVIGTWRAKMSRLQKNRSTFTGKARNAAARSKLHIFPVGCQAGEPRAVFSQKKRPSWDSSGG